MTPRKSQDRIFPLIAMCTALFAGMLISESRADVQGIPDHDVFIRAEYPYARVLETCTTWRRPEGMGDTWGVVSFRAACQQHDKCFHSQGASWGSCNRQFLVDLRGACDRDLKAEVLARGGLGEPEPEQVQLCYEIANLFHGQVQKPDVRKRFTFAQEVQEQYRGHVEVSLRQLFSETIGREPSAAELANAFESLDSGMSFDDIKRGLGGEETTAAGHAILESESPVKSLKTVSEEADAVSNGDTTF